MARNLKRAGATVRVFNRTQCVLDEFSHEGFSIVKTPAQAAIDAEFVICMVADTPAVETVLLGPRGVQHGISSDSIVVDMGTTDIQTTRQLAGTFAEQKVSFVDAPVSGGEIGAIDGSLSIMVGGSNDDVQQVRPVLNEIGSQVIHIGPVGCGQIAKAANQIVVGVTIGAIAEAFALAESGGADTEKVWRALKGGFADSKVLSTHGKRMIEGDFVPGGSALTQRKDLQQALDFATQCGVTLPSTSLCRDLYESLIEQGDGNLDHSALYRLYTMKTLK